MKNIINLILWAACAAMIWGCQTDSPVESRFDLSTDAVSQNQSAKVDCIVTVEASDDVHWQASVDAAAAEWITFKRRSGTGSERVVFSLAENTTVAPRTAVITVEAASDATKVTFTRTVTVQQAGQAPYLSIEPSGSINISYEADATYSVSVKSNAQWRAQIDFATVSGAGWITLVEPSDTATGDKQVILNIAENPNSESREATLTVSCLDDTSLKSELTITQQRLPARYNITINGMIGYLPDGDAMVKIVSASGTESTFAASIIPAEGATVISYGKMLAAGDYTLVCVTSASQEILLGGEFTIGAESVCTYIERWNNAFTCFGGQSDARAIKISTPNDLDKLASLVNQGSDYAALHYTQTADISLAQFPSWQGIGTAQYPFAGVYDGAGKKISSMNITIGEVQTFTTGDITVTCGYAFFSHISGTDAEHTARISNLTIETGTINSTVGYAGGISGRASGHVVISNCVNSADINTSLPTAGPGHSGGIMHTGSGVVVIENCHNYGIVTVTSGMAACNGVGGIVGVMDGASATDRAKITGCSNHGTIYYYGNTGGIAGVSNGNLDIVRSANFADMIKVADNNFRMAGILGSLAGEVNISECFNTAKIGGDRNAGTIVGWSGGTGGIENCYNSGELECRLTTGNTGGLVGNITTTALLVRNCYNSGSVKSLIAGTPRFGAIAGSASGLITAVQGCYYLMGTNKTAGLGLGTKTAAKDIAGQAEGKDETWFTSGTAFPDWNPAVWNFTPGAYPTLKNNALK